ncbi:plant intracellular Ras-group-related LRR protein 3-like isoform X2 [Homalodisca vitripennis]|uniref:plant intracellular Ras-group-related LRR protein 3-like isoform X2 n=1 Tax=Homalodisca vitripennis TaxID=197043 RepID=UPI001EEADEE1|nr:plant intracellular Ras-group-related LRR protein 3-like isoform X2 [Homalodisca vitripennis]
MIEALPVEIGSLHSLRGIQLARNPIVYPPQNIINQGVQATIHFLRRQWQQLKSPKHIQLISETHSQTKTACPKSKSCT